MRSCIQRVAEAWSWMGVLKSFSSLPSPTSDQKYEPLLLYSRIQMLEMLKLAICLHENLSVSYYMRQRQCLPGLFWRVALKILTSLLLFYVRLSQGGQWGTAQPWVLFNYLVDEQWDQDLAQPTDVTGLDIIGNTWYLNLSWKSKVIYELLEVRGSHGIPSTCCSKKWRHKHFCVLIFTLLHLLVCVATWNHIHFEEYGTRGEMWNRLW